MAQTNGQASEKQIAEAQKIEISQDAADKWARRLHERLTIEKGLAEVAAAKEKR